MHQNHNLEYESVCSEDIRVLFLILMLWVKSSIKLIL